MKNYYTIALFLFIANTAEIYAQYLPLLEDGKEWNYLRGAGNSTFTDSVSIQGDTLINGIAYKRFVSANFSLDSIVFLREDTVARQVFFLRDSVDLLLYDFSVSVGDTVSVFTPYVDAGELMDTIPIHCRVTKIDTIMDLLNVPRKQFWLLPYLDNTPPGIGVLYTPRWVEGVGGLFGFVPTVSNTSISSEFTLLCAWNNGIQYYQVDWRDSCYYHHIGIDTYSDRNNAIKLYPNPAHSTVTFEMDDVQSYIKSLSLYDLRGREVMTHQVHGRSVQIDISAYASGLYTARLLDSNGAVYVKKLIVDK